MSNATEVQKRPHGTGREVTPLVLQDVVSRPILVPEEGLKTVALWVRSAAAYLKSRQLEVPQETKFNQLWALAVAKQLQQDVEERTALGELKYGERLRAHNGRDALMDAYQELLDAWQYLRQYEEETEVVK